MGKKDKISADAMTLFRKQQKVKEKKKIKVDRVKGKTSKVAEMDPTDLREKIKKLEREEQNNALDGAGRQRKQELEDTLRQVLRHRADADAEAKATKAATAAPEIKTAKDLANLNAKTYKNPQLSVHYDPVFNPFGVAPPPGHAYLPNAPKVGPAAAAVANLDLHNDLPGQPPLPKGPRPRQRNRNRPPLPSGPRPYRPPPPPPSQSRQTPHRPVVAAPIQPPPPPTSDFLPPPPPPPPSAALHRPPPPPPVAAVISPTPAPSPALSPPCPPSGSATTAAADGGVDIDIGRDPA